MNKISLMKLSIILNNLMFKKNCCNDLNIHQIS